MDLNFICSEINLRHEIDARLRNAGYIQRGTGSPLVAAIGRSAETAARLAGRIARWADGSPDPAAQHRAIIH